MPGNTAGFFKRSNAALEQEKARRPVFWKWTAWMERCGCLATAYIPSGKRPYKRYFWMRSWFSAIAAPPAMGTISWIPETWMEIVRTCWIFCRGFPESWREMGIASGLLLGFLPPNAIFRCLLCRKSNKYAKSRGARYCFWKKSSVHHFSEQNRIRLEAFWEILGKTGRAKRKTDKWKKEGGYGRD